MGIYSDKPWMKSYFIGPFKLPKTMEPYPEISVYTLLEETEKEFTENIACEYLEQQITYKELKNKVDRLATALANLGVKKGDTVATILPTCIEFIIVDFAIMRLGAIHAPLSILHKADELAYELKESKTKTVICSYRRLDRINEIRDEVTIQNLIYTPVAIFPEYTLPEVQKVPDAYLLNNLIEENEPNPPTVTINAKEDLALLPFTGGTTGVPKGTMLSHFNITSNIKQSIQWFLDPLKKSVRGKSAALICVPIYHAYGLWAVHASVSWGLRMILTDARDIEQIGKIIKKKRPFSVYGVPTHYMELLKHPDIKKMPVLYISGAAALPPKVAENFEKKTGVPMTEGYGMTETSPLTHINISAISKVTRFMTEVKRSIGVPVPDTEVRLVDTETGEEAAIGEPGEILIRGPQVMVGYWPDKGKGLQKDGWLATGDIGKMDEDGYFSIVDRIKDMINVSGMKVYSRVIDDVLHAHPAIRMAGVIGLPDPDRLGSERVKAYVVLKDDFKDQVTEKDILDYCKEKLPPYAIPKLIDLRDFLPLTRVMKLDKKKLKAEEIK